MIESITPFHRLNPVAKKQIQENQKRFTAEERLLSLMLTTMVLALGEDDLKLKYVQKNLLWLQKTNRATGYLDNAGAFVEASNRVWFETFKEIKGDVSISAYMTAIIYKRQKQYKKLGVNYSDFKRLWKAHAVEGYTMHTTKVVNRMLEKIKKEVNMLQGGRRDEERY